MAERFPSSASSCIPQMTTKITLRSLSLLATKILSSPRCPRLTEISKSTDGTTLKRRSSSRPSILERLEALP
tara:strand:+ start:360 stop:575 length:216 start_codon:yes stop_codon:yes gene_type:complete